MRASGKVSGETAVDIRWGAAGAGETAWSLRVPVVPGQRCTDSILEPGAPTKFWFGGKAVAGLGEDPWEAQKAPGTGKAARWQGCSRNRWAAKTPSTGKGCAGGSHGAATEGGGGQWKG